MSIVHLSCSIGKVVITDVYQLLKVGIASTVKLKKNNLVLGTDSRPD